MKARINKMNSIQLCLDKKAYKTKPEANETGSISNRIAENITNIDYDKIREFAEKVGAMGHTWIPATFINSKRNKSSFDQMQLFALDFDNGITWKEVRNRSKKYNIPVLFSYATFSSQNCDKFRAVFLNDVSISDQRAANVIITALMTVFPECDSACKDVSHLYYGGKELIYFDDNIPEMDIESLIRNMCLYLKYRFGNTHYKRKIVEFADKTGVKLNQNKLPDILVSDNFAEEEFGKISPDSIILPKDFGEILPKRYYRIALGNKDTNTCSAKKTHANHAAFRSSDINLIRKNCRLFREFENGKEWLYHNQLFGLAVSLIQIETGSRVFLNALLANSHYESYADKYNQWKDNLDYFKQSGYKPYKCDTFCPYKDECDHGTNLLSCARIKYHTIEKLTNYEEKYYPVEEVTEDVRGKITAALNADDICVHIIKAQTAIGKTQVYLELMANSHKKFLVAVPTNILKHDVYDRARAMGIDVMETPSIKDIPNLPADVRNHIERLYDSGRHKGVTPYIKKVIKEQNIQGLQDYLDDLKAVKEFDGHIITTHRRLLNSDEEYLQDYEIIIDEDIISKSVIPNQVTIETSKLEEILGDIHPKSELSYKIRDILDRAETEFLFRADKIECPEEENNDIPCIDISSLYEAEYFCSRKKSAEKNLLSDCISFFKPAKFQKVKYIMVSATADETVCKYYFGEDRVRFYECKKAKYKGTLNQYYDRSMSRADIHSHADTYIKIKEKSGELYTITFMEHRSGAELYFGNTEGCSFPAGENINVVGTPHYPPFLYKLFAYTIGLSFDIDEELTKNKLVRHNGYQFKFTAYDD
jgi:hypothetical protein